MADCVLVKQICAGCPLNGQGESERRRPVYREMATRKKTSSKKSSSGSDPKSKGIVKKKMGSVMHEFKHHELESGRSGRKVKNPKQAIAIGLSEARRSGAKIPPSPNQKKTASKKSATKKKSAPAKKTAPRKSAAKKTATKKSTSKKSASKKRS